MTSLRRVYSGLAALVIASSMAACGGGGGNNPSPRPTPSPSPTPSPTPSPSPSPSGGPVVLNGCNNQSSTASVASAALALSFSGGEIRRPAPRHAASFFPGRLSVSYNSRINALSAGRGRVTLAGQIFAPSRQMDFAAIGRSAVVIDVKPGSEDQTLAQIRRDPNVVMATRVPRVFAMGIPSVPFPVTDPYFPVQTGSPPHYIGQWDMHFIGAASAWGFSTQTPAQATLGNGVRIAIVDTGADIAHPDIANKVTATKCFVSGAVNPTGSDVSDLEGHGTNVAGIAAATGNNSVGGGPYGFAGVGYSSTLSIYKVFPNPPAAGCGGSNDPACGADPFDIAQSLNDIVATNGAQVVNMSLGSTTPDATEEAAVANAIAHNIVVVAAAGNEYKGTLDYPAADPGVIAAGATSLNETAPYSVTNPGLYVASYSNWNGGGAPSTLIVAPGGDPTTADLASGANGGVYLHWIEQIYSSQVPPVTPCSNGLSSAPTCRILIAGTSQATPHIAGAAALLLGAGASAGSVKTALCSTADPATAAPIAGLDPAVPAGRPASAQGCGNLNIYRAMAVQLGFGDPMTPGSLTL